MFSFFQSKPVKICYACLWMVSLSACMFDNTDSNNYFWDMPNAAETNTLYPESYDTQNASQTSTPPTKIVVVPASYHVGVTNTPPNAKDEDRQWVENQNPAAYTIEIAQDAKPSHVANVLYKIPKNQRSAEVKIHNGNYLGVYGSFSSREAAAEQLQALPEAVKQQATIKNWGSVQQEIE